MFKRYLLPYSVVLLLIGACASGSMRQSDAVETSRPLAYEINLNDRADDQFHVVLKVDDLTADNAIYQFAATAPGTYQVMDIGRYVRDFEALDATGSAIAVERLGTNQWEINSPEQVSEIRYAIAETWDTPVDSNFVYRMAGTSIEEDHVQFMTHAVLGYPTGMQARPLKIKFDYPEKWKVGTALDRDDAGFYHADDYDHAVDSPVLLGRLSYANLEVEGSDVDIYTYSATDKVKSSEILEACKDILLAAADFMDGMPVDRYTFLFHFEDLSQGAWEHSYSSNYVYKEATAHQTLDGSLRDVIAHEFYHVVTPLNIHSEVIEQFNFVEPEPSVHLWLYEAVTEWAAYALQLRAGLIDEEAYLGAISTKLKIADNFDNSFSLVDLAMTSFTPKGAKQYGNIYQRGAIIAGLLDLRLLELSEGKRGLRDVINELSQIYGPEKAFPEEDFFEIFTDMTYPEIGEFFERYVKDTEPLPLAEYYAKLGVNYIESRATGDEKSTAGYTILAPDGVHLVISQVSENALEFGLREGDIIVGYNGMPVDLSNVQKVFADYAKLEPGVPYTLTVSRDGEELTITCEKFLQEKVERHVFELAAEVSPEQLALRESWKENI